MQPTTTVRTYKSVKQYKRDVQRMARKGWRVQSTTEHENRSSLLRIAALGGVGALVFHPKPTFVVTYVR